MDTADLERSTKADRARNGLGMPDDVICIIVALLVGHLVACFRCSS